MTTSKNKFTNKFKTMLTDNRFYVIDFSPIRFLLVICFAFFSTANLVSQVIYVNAEGEQLYRYDVANCTYELVVNIEQISTISDIAFHPNGNLYGITSFGQLVGIDTLTGSLSLVNNFPFDFDLLIEYTSLTIDANGVAYTSDIDGELRTYDFSNGSSLSLGNTGYPAAGDLTFYEGNLYVSTSDDEIVQIDIDNPANSNVIISVPGFTNLFGFVSNWEGCNDVQTYLFSNNEFSDLSRVYTVNFDTNETNFICNSDIVFYGSASPTEYLASITPFSISEIYTENTTCGEDNGFLSVNASGSTEQLGYSLDGNLYQDSSFFENLAAGMYTIYVKDELDCVLTEEFQIENSEAIILQDIEIQPAICGVNNGSIELITANETAFYNLNGAGFSEENLFEFLAAGAYNIIIQNEAGCDTIVDVSIEDDTQTCQNEVPNVFTPNGDGINDIFNVVTFTGFEGSVTLEIYNRWGENIFSGTDGWDGTKLGQAVPADVYAYIITVNNNQTSKTENFLGDVTLIR